MLTFWIGWLQKNVNGRMSTSHRRTLSISNFPFKLQLWMFDFQSFILRLFIFIEFCHLMMMHQIDNHSLVKSKQNIDGDTLMNQLLCIDVAINISDISTVTIVAVMLSWNKYPIWMFPFTIARINFTIGMLCGALISNR